MPDSFVGFTKMDYSKEKSRVDMGVVPITDGTTLSARLTQFAALLAAVDGVTNGTTVATQVVQDRNDSAPTPPTTPTSQRELKWLVVCADIANNVSKIQIPTADLSVTDILKPNSDEANWNGTGAIAAWTDFVTAFQAIYRNNHGNAVTITDIRLVGRNI